MINALFDKDEIALIDQFANVSALATGGAVNASKSANQMFNLLGRLGAPIGSTSGAQFLTRVVGARMVREAYGGARAASLQQELTLQHTILGKAQAQVAR